MPPGFYAAGLTSTAPAIQQVRVSTIALQPPSGAAQDHAITAVPIKDLVFQQAISSHVFFNINKNGPVITADAVAFYNDRFDTDKKW